MTDATYAEAKPAATAYAEPARRMTLNGWAVVVIFLPPALLLFTVFVFLPIVEAGWYGFFNWNGYGRPREIHRAQELRLSVRQRDLPARR